MMCLNPVEIKNPNFGKLKDNKYMVLKDCSHQYIYVPCGHCDECIAVKQMNIVQRVQMESRKNHIFFSTVTYCNEELPRIEVNGYSIPYADISDLQNMIRRIRHYNLFPRQLRYFAVTELGTKRGRPHAHILWLVPKYKDDSYYTCLELERKLYDVVLSEWKRNYGTRKNPLYEPLLHYHERWQGGVLKRNYDTHYVNPVLSDNGSADVTWYVLKYMLKPSDRETRLQQALHLNLEPDEYDSIWSLVRPRYIHSLDFGLKRDSDIQNYLHDCVQRSFGDFDYPCYFNPDNGQSFPLARFYKDCPEIYSIDDAFRFYMEKDSKYVDSSDEYELKTAKQAEQATIKAMKRLRLVEDASDNLLFY